MECKWSYREIADSSRTGDTAIFDSLDIQLEELSKGELFNTNEENGYEKKDEDMLEEVMLPQNFTLKVL